MMPRRPESREGRVDLTSPHVQARAGFRTGPEELLAGGPVELEFFVETGGTTPLRLAVAGDRARQRPGQFGFMAKFDGLMLDDPLSAAPELGGPMGVVSVSAGTPWRQPVVLNQFIRLEHTRERLAEGATGRLEVACRRPLALAATDAAALMNDAALMVAVDLALDLRRDDAKLKALAARLLEEVVHGPLPSRERPLMLLLSMRSAAHDEIEALTRHGDPSVAERARRVSEAIGR